MLGEQAPSSTRKTICLVDDEPDITSVIKSVMEQEGYIVHDFNDPKKALEHFLQDGKDCTLVISDVRMPGMSGFELCRKIKDSKSAAKVILMTAFEINQSEFSHIMPHTTVDGFIRKPISLKKLKELVNEITSPAK